MSIRYATVESFEGWGKALNAVSNIALFENSKNILEIGSGANPTLPESFIKAHSIDYTTNDISSEELLKAPSDYKRLCFDFSEQNPPNELKEKYDFVFSRMVNEHVRNGENYYRNIYSVLQRGGLTVHWFSTLYAFPFFVNKYFPDSVSGILLNILSPRDRYQYQKFKAYYSWGRGPSHKMQARFTRLGFQVVEYTGYFGHTYYRKRIPLLHKVEMRKAQYLVNNPIPHLTSYACVKLRKI
jgi:hypothetical protein